MNVCAKLTVNIACILNYTIVIQQQYICDKIRLSVSTSDKISLNVSTSIDLLSDSYILTTNDRDE